MDDTKEDKNALEIHTEEVLERLKAPLLCQDPPFNQKINKNERRSVDDPESDVLVQVLGRCLISSRHKKQQKRKKPPVVSLKPQKTLSPRPLLRESKLGRVKRGLLRKPRLNVVDFSSLSDKSLCDGSVSNREQGSPNSLLQSSCSQQALNPSYPTEEETSIEELAAYFECFVHIPKKMSSMAEMMYT